MGRMTADPAQHHLFQYGHHQQPFNGSAVRHHAILHKDHSKGQRQKIGGPLSNKSIDGHHGKQTDAPHEQEHVVDDELDSRLGGLRHTNHHNASHLDMNSRKDRDDAMHAASNQMLLQHPEMHSLSHHGKLLFDEENDAHLKHRDFSPSRY
ncbi:hypothetical protein CBS101457_004444 [Exobasidium rhododendri]|nr:hypothetical protein CBS101457_004444 [Exobasidium rhododendri]